MLEKRYVAGKWLYRVSGALVWSYSRMDAMEQAKQGTQDVSQFMDASRTSAQYAVSLIQN